MALNNLNSDIWYQLSPQKVLNKVKSAVNGLSEKEAKKRLLIYGENKLNKEQNNNTIRRFFLQFNNVLIYLLIASCFVTSFLGYWVDTSVIAGVIIINAFIGFVQEGKAEKALEAVSQMLTHKAIILRNGKRYEALAKDLVPGDIVLLQSGNKVPADLRLLKSYNLHIDESLLTGESVPVAKNIDSIPTKAPIAERYNIAYSGTYVTHGQGVGVVVNTGEKTELGKISLLLKSVITITTPLLDQISRFGRQLTAIIVILSALSMVFGHYVRNLPIHELLLIAVSLAVAAIPEGLPAVITITLAIGVQRMAKRHVIIRKLPAVETLGAVTTICTDKTGTLTCNEMTVKKIISADHLFDVNGVGYAPFGEVCVKNNIISPNDYPELINIGHAAQLCNEANLRKSNDSWVIDGDSTDGALLTLAMKLGLSHHIDQKSVPRLDVIPFGSEHGFMATLHHDHANHRFIYVKGAPERIIEMCSMQRSEGEDKPINHLYWHKKLEEEARLGYRLIAVATKKSNDNHNELQFSDMKDLTLLVVFAIIDPPRTEAANAIAACQKAGIKVKMITGDHALTAQTIGAKLGLHGINDVITGQELSELDNKKLSSTINKMTIFARTSPELKLNIVKSLQDNSEIVAMTGDGANDAPALKRADIGVAMGEKGTEVAKQASEMVITNDNFAAIVNAIEEGRTVYDNLRKAIVYILPTSIGEALILFIALLFGFPMPITPVQILWINMVTAVTLSISLAFEKPQKSIMVQKPRDSNEPILSWFLIWRVIFVSGLLVIGTLVLFLWEQNNGTSLQVARSIAVNTLVIGEIFYLFNCKHMFDSVLTWQKLTNNKYVFIAIFILLMLQVGFTYSPIFHYLFGVASLTLVELMRIFLFGIILLLIVELEKFFIRYLKKHQNPVKE